jgi:type IV fimbrial biogenesis protein FimT
VWQATVNRKKRTVCLLLAHRRLAQCYRRGMKQSGFTLIELLVTVSVVGVLAALAMPGLQAFVLKRAVESAADTLVSDMRQARSEAVKRSTRVVICASSNGTSCTGSGALWKSGWMIYVPSNANGDFTTGDEIVKVQQELTSITSIADTDGTSRYRFIYESSGSAKASSQTFVVTPAGDAVAGTTRLICISNNGRAGIKAAGSSSCA